MWNFLKSHLAHLVSYTLSAAGLVAGLDPGLLPPPWGLVVAVAGAIVTAAHHSSQVTKAAMVEAAAKAITAAGQGAKVFFPPLMALLLTAGSLAACKTTPTAGQQTAITVAVDLATGFAIQQHDSDPKVWGDRARHYKAIALELKAVNDAGTATLATLQADLEPLVAKLPVVEQLAANALVVAIKPYLDQQLGSNPNLANTRAAVDQILDTVLAACAAYGA